MRRCLYRSILVLVLSVFSTAAFAATEVKFGKVDLDSLATLAKLEQTTLRFNDRLGEFVPGPSLRFVGMEPATFDVDLDLGGNIVNLRFNNLRGKALTLNFEDGRARLDLGVTDQEKAIRSLFGSISVKGVVLSAWGKFDSRGSTRLDFDDVAISGEIVGTGLLKPEWVIKAIRGIVTRILREQVQRQLARPNVQESIDKAFVTWAKFSTDGSLARVVPGSVKVDSQAIRYQAEK